jgi:hypothetical protein
MNKNRYLLSSRDLMSKWGFHDGDIFDSREVLVAAVRKYLEPKLPAGVVLYEICSIHNPIRAEDESFDILRENPDVEVWLTDEMVCEIMAGLGI